MSFELGDMCYLTYPCQHNVIFNDENIKNKRMTGPQIYNLYKKEDLDIPEHFMIYKDLAKVLDNVNSIKNKNANYAKLDDANLGKYLLEACQNNNMNLARYLVEIRNTPITLKVIKKCCDNLEMLRWVMEKKGDLNITDINLGFFVGYMTGDVKMDYYNHKGNILSYVTLNNNDKALKYLIEEVGISLDLGPDYSKPLIVALMNDNKELSDYLTQVCIGQKAMFYGADIDHLKKFELYDKFSQAGLIFNENTKYKCEIIIRDRITEVDLDIHKIGPELMKQLSNNQINYLKKQINKDLNEICNKPLPKSGQVRLKLNHHEFEYLDIIITIKPGVVSSINFNCGGHLFPFEKVSDNEYRLPKLTHPIHVHCLMWNTPQYIDINFDKPSESTTGSLNELNVKIILLRPKYERRECLQHSLVYKLTDEYVMFCCAGVGQIQKISEVSDNVPMEKMIEIDPDCENYIQSTIKRKN